MSLNINDSIHGTRKAITIDFYGDLPCSFQVARF